jgi:hypothetical protein
VELFGLNGEKPNFSNIKLSIEELSKLGDNEDIKSIRSDSSNSLGYEIESEEYKKN